VQLLKRPVKVAIYTSLGKTLQFYGDIFCICALISEEKRWMRAANLWWIIGVWFYKRADTSAWSQILDPESYPKKKYIYN